ncbi:MAG: tetratricopeptide repeat protein [Saprospiraceae bacterium]|nr:tetratricopeptide repeat protein [Saprospiraceae bacterium]
MQGLLPAFIDDHFDDNRHLGEMGAIVLFADLKGFTSYTEKLMKEGKSGAERLSTLLNDVFGSAATAIHRRGGFIPYFAGDAFAGIFPNHLPIESALYAAEEIRQSLHRLQVEIPLRIGIDQGPLRWHITSETPHSWYIRGEGMAKAVAIQSDTPAGEIQISRAYAQAMASLKGVELFPADPHIQVKKVDIGPAATLSEDIVKHTSAFYPTFLTQRFHEGEFRKVTSLFLAFPETLSIEEVDLVLQVATSEVYRREGYYKETDFTDKGGLLVAFFGAPINTGESRRMAIQTALALMTNPSLVHLPLHIGISTGSAFCGLAGNDSRRQYVVASKAVNLAARLSMIAAPSQILCDEVTITGLNVNVEALPEVQAKGFTHPIPVFCIHSFQEEVAREDVLYGRQEELQHIVHILEKPKGKCLEILGEPGIGKTFLTRAVCRSTRDRIDWLNLHGNPANTAPFADLDQAWSEEINVHVREDVSHLMEEVRRLRSADELSPRVRFERIEEVHQRLLSNGERDKPLGILIEHWQDLDHATRKMIHDRIQADELTIVCTGRTPIDALLQIEPVNHPIISLDGLDQDGVRTLAQTVLGGPASDTLLEILQRAGNGNPFYSEQLLLYLRDNNLLHHDGEYWTVREAELTLGGTLRDILMARLDRLEQGVREVLKSASVIGTSFALPVLIHMMEASGEHTDHLSDQLEDAERAEILKALDEMDYIFRHSLLREVIYDVQLGSRLEQLHRLVVAAMERVYQQEIGPHLGALASHCEMGGWMEKAVEYLIEAGRYALKQYQNREALEFFTRALKQVDPSGLPGLILEQLPAFEALGQWQNALTQLDDPSFTTTIDPELLAHHQASRGHFLVLLGDYPAAWTALQEAIRIYESMNDLQGVSLCHKDLATLYFRQGDYQQAETYITRSMLMIDDPAQVDNQLVMSLALIRMNQGRYVEAEQLLYNDLLIRHQTGEKQCLISLYTNLGIVQNEMGHFDVALRNLEKGLVLAEEMGHRLWISIALGTRGLVREQLGQWEEALSDFRQDLLLSRELQDLQGESIALELLGSLLLRQGDWAEGETLVQRSLELSRQIGYRKGQVKVMCALARARQIQGRPEAALQLIEEATQMAEEMNNRKLLANCRLSAVWILLENGDVTKASPILSLAEEDVWQWDDPAMQRELMILSARILPGNKRKAVLSSFLGDGHDPELMAEAAYHMALLTDLQSDREKALSLFEENRSIVPLAIYGYRMKQLQ